MAGTETLLDLAKFAGVVAPVGQGLADRSAARYNADVYRTQARQTLEAAATDEALARREGRQVTAKQAASAYAEGQGDSSAMDVIRQNEVNLIADALAIRRRGQVQAEGFSSRAAMAEYEGDQALYAGLQGTGAELLTTVAERRARERQLEEMRSRRRSKAWVS